MKSYFYLFSLALVLFSCSDETLIEDELYKEIVAEYKKEGIKLEPLLDEIEEQLISERILSGKGGLAKVKYYEEIVATGEVVGSMDLSVFEPLMIHPFNAELMSKCQNRVKKNYSVSFEKSSFRKKMENL